MGGDFSCTLDPNIADMVITVMVVGVGADNKGFMGNSSARVGQGVFPYTSSEFE